jgi:hypothetical protein
MHFIYKWLQKRRLSRLFDCHSCHTASTPCRVRFETYSKLKKLSSYPIADLSESW